MKITVEGVVYDHDPKVMLVSEALDVQAKLDGMSMARWQQGLNQQEPLETKALVYLLKKRAGEKVDWDTLDFNLVSFEIEDDEEEPDPTGAETSSSA